MNDSISMYQYFTQLLTLTVGGNNGIVFSFRTVFRALQNLLHMFNTTIALTCIFVYNNFTGETLNSFWVGANQILLQGPTVVPCGQKAVLWREGKGGTFEIHSLSHHDQTLQIKTNPFHFPFERC